MGELNGVFVGFLWQVQECGFSERPCSGQLATEVLSPLHARGPKNPRPGALWTFGRPHKSHETAKHTDVPFL